MRALADRMNVIQSAISDVKEVAKFKTFGKDITTGLTNFICEKVDLTLLSEFRKDY